MVSACERPAKPGTIVAAFVSAPISVQTAPSFGAAALELTVPKVESKRAEVKIATRVPTFAGNIFLFDISQPFLDFEVVSPIPDLVLSLRA